MEEITFDNIKRSIEEHFANGDLPYMKRYPSGIWEIYSGGPNGTRMYTGDQGAKRFEDAMREQSRIEVTPEVTDMFKRST